MLLARKRSCQRGDGCGWLGEGEEEEEGKRGAGAAGSGEPQTGVWEEERLCNTILRLAAEKCKSLCVCVRPTFQTPPEFTGGRI